MCGICGYVNVDNKPIMENRVLSGMMNAIMHRGPDDEGKYVKDNVALGHRRLSIIDLAGGHQPIVDEKNGLVVVYNGEIYNFLELMTELLRKGHTFNTHSDSEVVLKAYKEWGPECLDKFNGMFAFAIWDMRDRSLFLARDRFGKKPLYYTFSKNVFVFGSELKAIFLHPSVDLEVDRASLGKYLAHDYVPAPRTIIKGVFKLEAGHYAMLKGGELEKKSYWDFHFIPKRGMISDIREAKKMLLDILRESVRKRLISDVPLGVFLSGGIDSSAIVAMMAQLMDPKDIKTFSIGFKERSYNEADSARLIAKHFNTDHYEKIIEADTMLGVFPKIIEMVDEPFADSSIIPTYIVSEFTRQKVKVALGGDGGDELFMGYPSFIAHRMAAMYERCPALANASLSLFSRLLTGRSGSRGMKSNIDRFLNGVDFPADIRHQIWTGSFSPMEQRSLFCDIGDEEMFDPRNIYSESIGYYGTYKDIPEIDRIEYLYIKTYLTDDILTKVDRASMASSLEVRAPFLDKDMAEFSGSIPDSLKLRGFTSKYVLKEALRGILPREILTRRKHGFAVPVSLWFKTGLKRLLLDSFNETIVKKDGIFNYAHIDKIFQDHFSGRSDNGRKMWSLLIYQLWYNKQIKTRKNLEVSTI